MNVGVHVIETYEAERHSFALAGSFDDAISAFEAAVPFVGPDDFARALRERDDWPAVRAWTVEKAINGFLIYGKNDVRPLFSLSGATGVAVAYLVGNHLVAAEMFRREPRVMNYAPLRVEFTQVPGEPVLLTVEAPSRQFGSFGDAQVAAVGAGLERKLDGLLALFDLEPLHPASTEGRS